MFAMYAVSFIFMHLRLKAGSEHRLRHLVWVGHCPDCRHRYRLVPGIFQPHQVVGDWLVIAGVVLLNIKS